MSSKTIADRIKEYGIFTRSVENPSPDDPSILIIYGQSGRGKSLLLEQYNNWCRSNRVPVAHVDLRVGSRDPVDIIATIKDSFYPLPLPKSCKALRTTGWEPTSISHNTAIGLKNEYTIINDPTLYLEEQKRYRISLAQALSEDLRAQSQSHQKRFVILFDNYDEADPIAQPWIYNHIIHLATPSWVPGLTIVLTAKEKPKPSSEWAQYSKPLRLDRLPLEDWQNYAKAIGCTLSDEEIRKYYEKHGDNMIWMADAIETLASDSD